MNLPSVSILFYIFFGFLVAGGLLFSNKKKSNYLLAVYILIYSFKQLGFLYETSPFFSIYPQFYMLSFPLFFLFGPSLYLHILFLNEALKISIRKMSIHLIPFLLSCIFVGYLYTMPVKERITYIDKEVPYIIMPVSIIIIVHVFMYALGQLFTIRKYQTIWNLEKRKYAYTILFIYSISAVLQMFLYIFSLQSDYFSLYYVITSTLILFVGYVLYYKPALFQKVKIKYANSKIIEGDKLRIKNKIDDFLMTEELIKDTQLNLDIFSKFIGEKKHYISQILSEEYKLSFNDLINKKRVMLSKKMLLDPNYNHLNMLGIANESGFSNKVTFNRSFLKYTQLTPSEFKKRSNK